MLFTISVMLLPIASTVRPDINEKTHGIMRSRSERECESQCSELARPMRIQAQTKEIGADAESINHLLHDRHEAIAHGTDVAQRKQK